ncbi:hypothetical protein M5K25_001251 [Dendrobium thyrsiflorum]|uniref:Reverse transcriptase zinc-binding domain-containing protein n=1 Tax=Dendrobium thyrsiflorum TaxID=117978 RepID=A0ABD0VQ02_DENTH
MCFGGLVEGGLGYKMTLDLAHALLSFNMLLDLRKTFGVILLFEKGFVTLSGKKLKISSNGALGLEEDCSLFKLSSTSKFSFKETRNHIRIKKHASPIFFMIWHNSISTTIVVFTWRVLRKIIPTNDNLKTKGFAVPSKCQCCCHLETMNHVFVVGPIAAKVWMHFDYVFTTTYFKGDYNIPSILRYWFCNSEGHIKNAIHFLILWFLWLEHNDAINNNHNMDHKRVISRVKDKICHIFNVNLLSIKIFNGCSDVALTLGLNSALRDVFKPNNPFIKLNSDGAVNPSSCGCGGIFRNFLGMLLLLLLGLFNPAMCFLLSLKLSAMGFIFDNSLIIDNHELFYLIREIRMLLLNFIYHLSHEFMGSNLPKHLVGLTRLDKLGLSYVKQ